MAAKKPGANKEKCETSRPKIQQNDDTVAIGTFQLAGPFRAAGMLEGG